MMLNKAVFLDRDGTIIKDTGYIKNPENVVLLEGALEAINLLIENSFLIFIVTNQSGVGRGLMTKNDVKEVNKKVLSLIGKEKIEDTLICYHKPSDNCNCRKPNTGLIEPIIKKYGIKEFYSIGDKDSDKELAERLNQKGIKLGEKNINTLLDAVKFILKQKL